MHRRDVIRHLARPLPALLLAAVGLGHGAVASAATEPAAEASDKAAKTDETDETEHEGTDWTPIIGSCLGVAFGGAIAVWQIRGLKKSD